MTAGASNSIDWITVEGFRSIARVERLPLKSVNILIGANGSGKSNLIGVFALLRALRLKRLDEYVERSGGADRNLHYGSKVTKEIFIEISFGGGEEFHEAHFAPTDADRLFLRSEAIGGPAANRVLDEHHRVDGVRKDLSIRYRRGWIDGVFTISTTQEGGELCCERRSCMTTGFCGRTARTWPLSFTI